MTRLASFNSRNPRASWASVRRRIPNLAVATAGMLAIACSDAPTATPRTVERAPTPASYVGPHATYMAIQLPVLPTGTNAEALGIGDGGHVVGVGDWSCGALRPVPYAAFSYHNGILTNVHALGPSPCFSASEALDANATGMVVGWYQVSGLDFSAFYYEPSTGFHIITEVPRDGYAFGVNDGGQVVGYYDTVVGGLHAFLWSAAQGFQDVHPSPAYTESRAYDINDNGQIVGVVDGRVARWTAGGPVHFGPREGVDYNPVSGRGLLPPLGIANGGALAGGVHTASGDSAWTFAGGTGTGVPFRHGVATDRSSRGRVVGWGEATAPPTYLVAKTEFGGAVAALPGGVPFKPSFAAAVNTCGDIAGWLTTAASKHRAVLWKISTCDP